MIRLLIRLAPGGKARPRAAAFAGRARIYAPRADAVAEAQIAALAEPYRPEAQLSGPLSLEVVAVFPRTLSLCGRSKRTGLPLQDPARRHHVVKPDADNVGKRVLDALRSWWTDDCVISDLTIRKRLAALDEVPHYEVTIRQLGECEDMARDMVAVDAAAWRVS